MQPKWLLWARELQAAAQSGLTYAESPYDRERYEDMRALAARIMAEGSGADLAVIEGLFAQQSGYATPKVDVRAAIFRERSVLLVSEMVDAGRWTMPGGLADVNGSPSENAVREAREEAGVSSRCSKLAAVYDRDKQRPSEAASVPHLQAVFPLRHRRDSARNRIWKPARRASSRSTPCRSCRRRASCRGKSTACTSISKRRPCRRISIEEEASHGRASSAASSRTICRRCWRSTIISSSTRR